MNRSKQLALQDQFTQFLIYSTPDEKVKVEIFLHDENIWLTQEKIAELFGVQRPAITKHLKNIFDSGEMVERSVSSILEHTAADDKKYKTLFYNLDAIISVGYRVNSQRATQFRIWATQVWKMYTNDKVGFSLLYPADMYQINEETILTTEPDKGKQFISIFSHDQTFDETKGLGPNFVSDDTFNLGDDRSPETKSLVSSAVKNNDEQILKKNFSLARDGNMALKKFGPQNFIRIFPGRAEGCFCFTLQYVTLVKGKFVIISMSSSVYYPQALSNDPKLMKEYERYKSMENDPEKLLVALFGNIDDVVSTFKVLP